MFRWLRRRGARAALAASGLVVLLLALDVLRPAEQQLGTRLAVAAIHLYQHAVSPSLARLGVRCRFQPTCSVYAEGVLRKRGWLAGGWLAVKRVARCGPWTPMGTVDPVP